MADAAAAEIGVTLPSAATHIGKVYTVKKIDASANAVLVSGSTAIDGVAFKTLASQNESMSAISDGAQWRVIHYFSSSAGF